MTFTTGLTAPWRREFGGLMDRRAKYDSPRSNFHGAAINGPLQRYTNICVATAMTVGLGSTGTSHRWHLIRETTGGRDKMLLCCQLHGGFRWQCQGWPGGGCWDDACWRAGGGLVGVEIMEIVQSSDLASTQWPVINNKCSKCERESNVMSGWPWRTVTQVKAAK